MDADGVVDTVRFNEALMVDALMVEERGRGRVVHGRNGCAIEVDPLRFPGARRPPPGARCAVRGARCARSTRRSRGVAA